MQITTNIWLSRQSLAKQNKQVPLWYIFTIKTCTASKLNVSTLPQLSSLKSSRFNDMESKGVEKATIIESLAQEVEAVENQLSESVNNKDLIWTISLTLLQNKLE